MEFYIFILVVLTFLAITDLTVGVANDAVNFLNSAIGSKAGTRNTIIIVASLGVLAGVTFSSGIMEVARKGIFNPEFFTMHEVMLIFLGVMFTDVFLLDFYNTFGIPTSTTVSIVFGILGGAVSMAFFKVVELGDSFSTVMQYINTSNVLVIISGIGLSIIFAFVFGSIIQFITRVIFTFNYKKTFKRYGSIYCGAALTSITYFILVKGAKGSTLIPADAANYLKENLSSILWISFLVWTVFWHAIINLTKVNVLKVIVLIGTFALALAFAANDLVNFIGAPLGALSAFQIGSSGDPMTITMGALKEPVKANTLLLLGAGAIMVITLWKSKKARSVTKTEVSLGRQEEGIERFESSPIARGIVRIGLTTQEIYQKTAPQGLQKFIKKRIDPTQYVLDEETNENDKPAFDMLRAAVNLMVSSALISFATSLKLPLSTTFVTFIVAMATALSDKAWGRDSAVYRVNGVITVIGGWFFTAFMAFSVAFVFTALIFFGKLVAIFALLGLGAFMFYRTARYHKEREEKFTKQELELVHTKTAQSLMQRLSADVTSFVDKTTNIIELCFSGLINDKRKHIKKAKKTARELEHISKEIIVNIFDIVNDPHKPSAEPVPEQAQRIATLQVINSSLHSLADDAFVHVNNHHKAPDKQQIEELGDVLKYVKELTKSISVALDSDDPKTQTLPEKKWNQLKERLESANVNQMKRIKAKKSSTRQSLIFIGTLNTTEKIAENLVLLFSLSAD